MTRRLQLARAAIALAERSDSFKFQARCQAHADEATRLLKRSYLQSRGAVRLLKLAENMQ